METQARRTPTDLELVLNELLSDIPLGDAIERPRNDLAPSMMRSEIRIREIEEEEEVKKRKCVFFFNWGKKFN